MRLCIPVMGNQFLRSEVCGHFGKAPQHLVVESESGEVEAVIGRNEAGRSECAPLAAMQQHGVEAVVCHSLGRGALEKLTALGIAVYRTDSATVQDVLTIFERGRLRRVQQEEVCAGHGGHGHEGCGDGHY
jgi:predicted Fe-Mo cluster-binding NifX family protein